MYNFNYTKLPLKNIKNVYPIIGGYVNLSFAVETINNKFFLKLQPNSLNNFFDYEVSSLKELQKKISLYQKLLTQEDWIIIHFCY